MKTLTSISVLVLSILLVSGPLSATSITDVNTVGINTASVVLTVDDDVATLTGGVNSLYEKDVLEKAAFKLEGVEEVRNLLSF